jgi:lipopolysaccharide/colanic/teichoic acid biosynthesis glycosyltransferase
MNVIELHLEPFSILFAAFMLIYFIAGLYEKHTSLFKNKLPVILLNVQLINTIVGITFFYFIPYFSIAPKTVLFLYLVLSLVFMYIWRMWIVFKLRKNKKQKAILLADSHEAFELREEINNNSGYELSFVDIIRPTPDSEKIISDIQTILSREKISMIVIDTHHPDLVRVIPRLYPIAMKGVFFSDIGKVYEMIFDRIPATMAGKTWFIEHVSSMAPKLVYDGVKRLIDICAAIIFGIISLVFYPFVIVAMKIENWNAPIFSYQNRVGQYNRIIKIMKFRTMTIANDDGKWGKGENKVTKVGAILRTTRIDELPQLWNVLKGDVSLIGPRPEFPEPVAQYSKEIPNYAIRHSVKPGLSGWAQIYGEHPHHGVDINMTENKLSYDLYYVKHRSFLIDLKIALRTIKVLLTFVGR